jgi:hypothetical protein
MKHCQDDQPVESVKKRVHLVHTHLAAFGDFIDEPRGISQKRFESPIKAQKQKLNFKQFGFCSCWSLGMSEVLSKGNMEPVRTRHINPHKKER